MRIMSFKPGHDGAIAALDASAAELIYSYEAEKDSFPDIRPSLHQRSSTPLAACTPFRM